jgi:hypothetical protein
MAEVPEAQFLEFERGIATQLGNAERLERCQSLEHFPAARAEWLKAVHLVCKQFHLGALNASRKPTLGVLKDFVLEGLRVIDTPEVLLRNMADVIHEAARQGDVEFFQNMARAFRRHERSKREPSLAWCIVLYWFAGLLWLMDDKAGYGALCAYTGTEITKDAYRKARVRLGLNVHWDPVKKRSPVDYDSGTKTYKFAPGWTWLEPNLSV